MNITIRVIAQIKYKFLKFYKVWIFYKKYEYYISCAVIAQIFNIINITHVRLHGGFLDYCPWILFSQLLLFRKIRTIILRIDSETYRVLLINYWYRLVFPV